MSSLTSLMGLHENPFNIAGQLMRLGMHGRARMPGIGLQNRQVVWDGARAGIGGMVLSQIAGDGLRTRLLHVDGIDQADEEGHLTGESWLNAVAFRTG